MTRLDVFRRTGPTPNLSNDDTYGPLLAAPFMLPVARDARGWKHGRRARVAVPVRPARRYPGRRRGTTGRLARGVDAPARTHSRGDAGDDGQAAGPRDPAAAGRDGAGGG